MTGFVLRAVIAAFGLWIATEWIDGFAIDSASTLLLAALLLGIVNAVLRPLMILLTLPFTVLTLGFFILVVNAAMLALVSSMLPGFDITSFRSAFFGALVVSMTGWVGSWLFGGVRVVRIDGQ
jgi:putative membrane protein